MHKLHLPNLMLKAEVHLKIRTFYWVQLSVCPRQCVSLSVLRWSLRSTRRERPKKSSTATTASSTTRGPHPSNTSNREFVCACVCLLVKRWKPCLCCGRPSCSSWSQLSRSVRGLLGIEPGSCCSSSVTAEIISVLFQFRQLLISQCCCFQTVLFAVHAHHPRCDQDCSPLKSGLPDRNARIILKCGKQASFSVRRDLRFIEVIENVCQRLLEYNLHKERDGSNRFAKVRLWVGSGLDSADLVCF